VIAGLVVLVLLVLPARAEEAMRGVALVIGQSDYEHIAKLPNPANDAEAIEGLLEDLGFDVTGVTDRDAKKLRRDIERFVEDAEGADAAIVYYSGHGIEAGGENWLVPVDADLDALNDAGEKLVPVSALLGELKAKVPLTIFLLDACRSNPFPPGALVKRGSESLPVASQGLTVLRGMGQTEEGSTAALGSVIGYAAEPGQPALDGEQGGNSPYAAAILRHLSALGGQEFGLVMRMVTEEVYLKTNARQRPWVNESLSKQLFFGGSVKIDADEAAITGERRALLLKISSLPTGERTKVEAIAQAGQVPMDTLFGILSALGEKEMPNDPAEVERLLKAQATRLKAMLDAGKALATDDPELKRLTGLADKALAEGAIKTARSFLDQAKEAVEGTRPTIESVEAQAKAKRIANAGILEKSASAAELDFDFLAAAEDFESAYGWVKDADRQLAAKYKMRAATALQGHGQITGDRASLAKAVEGFELALTLVDPATGKHERGKILNNLANTYLITGGRDARDATDSGLTKAVELYREALDLLDPDEVDARSISQSNLGIALQSLAERRMDLKLLDQAEEAYAQALALQTREQNPVNWASVKANMGSALMIRADRSTDLGPVKEAIGKFNESLEVFTREEHPVFWANAINNLGAAQRLLGARTQDAGLVAKAIDNYQQSLTVFTREKTPLDWASANGNIGIAMMNASILTMDMSSVAKSLPHFKDALSILDKAKAPVVWGNLQNNYGMALQLVGQGSSDPAVTEQSAVAFRHALEVFDKEYNSTKWAATQQSLAMTAGALATMKSDVKLGDEAIAHYRAALEVYTHEDFPAEWHSTMSGLATTLQSQGIITQQLDYYQQAQAIYDDVLKASPRDKRPTEWANTMKNMGVLQFMVGLSRQNRQDIESSISYFDQAMEELNISGTMIDRMMVEGMRQQAVTARDMFK
jgi:uncharacterized caspase-like protein/ankyrin repeat protein